MHEGLKPMSRQWVHLSKDYDTAVNVGSRHGKAIVLRINAKQFVADGNELYISDNGVWQTKYVDPKYMEIYTPQEET
jgi:putative RNA 2'-phosphotransferase